MEIICFKILERPVLLRLDAARTYVGNMVSQIVYFAAALATVERLCTRPMAKRVIAQETNPGSRRWKMWASCSIGQTGPISSRRSVQRRLFGMKRMTIAATSRRSVAHFVDVRDRTTRFLPRGPRERAYQALPRIISSNNPICSAVSAGIDNLFVYSAYNSHCSSTLIVFPD